jgi:tape measure domain-containing protein
MAEYNINFSTNASQIAKELSNVQAELAKAVQMAKPGGLKIQLSLDASGLEESINTTFRKINKAIESNQRKLSRLQIGGANFRMIAERLGTAEGQRERGRAIAEPIRLRAQAAAFEPGSLTSMQKVLQALRIEASQITPNTVEWVRFQQQIGEVTLELKQADKTAESIQLTQQLGALAPGSLSRLDKQLTILKNRARDITPNTVEWKKLNKEIQKVETSIAKVSKKPLSAGQRAGAAGGAFLYGGGMGGGVGSAFGGIAGGLMGGVPGAFTGAAIGQAVDNLGGALAGITSQAAAVQQLQRGLALASIDAKDFAEAQSAVADVSSRLFIPLEQVTKSFAQLRVNTKQYGLSVEETKQILEGTILAVSAFGGSADDVDGAMRAVVQILSKGSVQAEELRGQLGERFPGAVIKFAQANKLSFDELQDRLKEGTTGIKEFVTFAKDNYEDYAEFSKTIATAPEFAGRRLAKALEEMQMVIGQVFGSSGATIQDFSSQALKDITKFIVDNKELLAQLAKDFAVVFAGIMSVVAEAGKFIIKVLAPVLSYIGSVIRQLRVMTGAADAATAKAEMNAAIVIIQRTRMGRDAFLTGEPRPGSFADKIEFDRARERYRRAEKRFKDAGGEAALPPETGTPPNLVFGGAGAGVSIDTAAKEDKENKKKVDNLESFERLRDQLANAYNQAEIERIKAEYELRKRLQEDMYDMQEFGANRLQRQNLQFLRALAKAEQDRQDTLMDAQLKVAEAAGKIAPSAPILPSAGGAGSRMSIVDVGKALQKEGFTVKEHPAFGGVTPGVHSPRGYHPTGEAIDVTDWRGGDWKGRTAGLKQAMGGVGFAELLGPGDKGHETHVHLAVGSGGISQEMFNKALATITGQGGIGAGAPRKVGSNESRDTMAGASVDIAQQNADIAERGSLLTKESAILKELGRYMQEVYNVPDLTLDNQLLKARNDLMEQGVDPSVIDHKVRLLELDIQYQHLLKAFPKFADDAKLSEEERIKILAILADALNNSTVAERAKNDETLRGIAIQRENQMQEALRSAAPLGGMGLSAGYIGSSGQKFEEVFQQTGSKETAAYFAELQNQLTLLETRNGAIQSSIMAIGDAFGTAMTTGIASLIDGTATAQEVFATFLKSIGQALLQAAQQMIATYIAIGIAKIFAGLGGGGNFTGGTSSAVPTDAAGWGSSFQTSLPGLSGDIGRTPIGFANGGIATGGFTAFANGGMVTGPTMGLVGEGKYNEAIVPLPDGKSIPVQMTGSSGGGSLRDAMNSNSVTNSSPVLNMSFQSTSINGVEYVSRDQLESAMAETRRNATRDGAKRGMTMTLDRIQNSSSTRRKVGI